MTYICSTCKSFRSPVTAYGLYIGRCAHACWAMQVTLGVLTFALGVTACVLLPVCYVPWTVLSGLGVSFLVCGGLGLSTAVSAELVNFPARVSVCLAGLAGCWVYCAITTQLGLAMYFEGFSNNNYTANPRVCPYVDPNTDQDQELTYIIVGSMALGFILIYLTVSIPAFTALWKCNQTTAATSYWTGVTKTEDPVERVDFIRGRHGSKFMAAPPTVQSDSNRSSFVTDASLWTNYHVTPGSYNFGPASSFGNGLNTFRGAAPRMGASATVGRKTRDARSVRLISADRVTRKAVVVTSLQELRQASLEKLSLPSSATVRVYFDDTGEEIEDDTYFRYIPDNSRLMVCYEEEGEMWTPPGVGRLTSPAEAHNQTHYDNPVFETSGSGTQAAPNNYSSAPSNAPTPQYEQQEQQQQLPSYSEAKARIASSAAVASGFRIPMPVVPSGESNKNSSSGTNASSPALTTFEPKTGKRPLTQPPTPPTTAPPLIDEYNDVISKSMTSRGEEVPEGLYARVVSKQVNQLGNKPRSVPGKAAPTSDVIRHQQPVTRDVIRREELPPDPRARRRLPATTHSYIDSGVDDGQLVLMI